MGTPPPVERPLEMALLRAGLMRKENYGNFSKVKWNRTSRTDKHVHALAAVIALKINCDAESWANDHEGLGYADAINRWALDLESDAYSSSRCTDSHHCC